MTIDLDKQSINYAAVFGLSEDLKLTGSQFSWCVSLFYFGQLCSEYPAAYLMSRLPIIRFVGVTMCVFSYSIILLNTGPSDIFLTQHTLGCCRDVFGCLPEFRQLRCDPFLARFYGGCRITFVHDYH